MTTMHLAAGELAYEEGSASDAIFVIKSGECEVARRVNGRRLRLAVLGPGEFFGETGVLLDQPRTVSIVALNDVQLIKITKDQFLGSFGDQNPLALPLLKMLAERLDTTNNRLAALVADKKPKPAAVGTFGAIKIFGKAPWLAKQIGPAGVPVNQLPFQIGRGYAKEPGIGLSTTTMMISGRNDPSLVPNHFAIEKRDGLLIVRDLGGPLGTVVNGVHLSRFGASATAALHLGDNEVMAGHQKSPFQFIVQAEPG